MSVALLPLAMAITGCGLGVQDTTSTDTAPSSMTGVLHGGNTPIIGATLSVYSVGHTGYGSTATQVGPSVTTGADGTFSFPSNTLTSCYTSAPNTPLYLISVGGNTGSGPSNTAAVLGAGLGNCGSVPAFVQINEITTAALAFSLSHFFSSTTGDTFGGPAGTGTYAPYAFGIELADAHTIPNLVNVSNGYATTSNSLYTVETAKINSIGNTLAACVNSTGASSAGCTGLFADAKAPGSATAPVNTLEAAVNMALYPYQNVTKLYNLAAAVGAPFPGLPTAPNDWTIGIAYTSSAFGLGIKPRTFSSIDIDTSGRVWFPTTAGTVGAGNFDPIANSFNGPYTNPSLVQPQQVAIDANGIAWFNDLGSPNVVGFNTASPSSQAVATLAGTVSTAITVNENDGVTTGIETSANGTYLADLTGGTYVQRGTSSLPIDVASIAADGDGSNGVNLLNPTGYYVSTNGTNTLAIPPAGANAGGTVFTGADYITAVPYIGHNGVADSICIFLTQHCSKMAVFKPLSPYGIAIDGDGTLWLADAANTINADLSNNTAFAGVESIPLVTPGVPDAYITTGGFANNHPYYHGTGNGATATTPIGIAVDAAGNVWVSNVGCTITAPATTCTPGAYVLSEIVGAGAPTLTPVSAGITGSTAPGTRP